MLTETRDVALVNGFAAHPDIAGLIGGPLDFSGAMRETAVFLFGEHGGFIFEWCAPGTFEAHAMLTQAGCGRWGFAAAREAVAMMAERGASHLWARCNQRHLVLFAALAGFRFAEHRTLYGPAPERCRIMEWRKPCPQQ